MQKRLHDKKAGVAILLALIVISIAEIIFRVIAIGKAVGNTPNFGEDVATIILATTILILTAKGKDRACYICYGAFVGYFILDQLFELPGMISTILDFFSKTEGIDIVGNITIVLRIVSMIAILAIGVLLVEYLNDGTICNRAFNALCIISICTIIGSIICTSYSVINGGEMFLLLDVINNLIRLSMVFLCAFFAYDSAKAQLKKTNLTK